MSPTCSDLIVSGSYDHVAKIWDRRQPEASIHSFQHGHPVEAVLMLPNGTLLVTAGGNEVKIWDLVKSKLLTTFSPHNKTITSLGLANQKTRLVTTSLDHQMKFHDLGTFRPVHSVSFPTAILSGGVAVSIVNMNLLFLMAVC